ncbi:GNAT family N-acetyltransferase [Paenibacillus radicis (ex Gao et al. 2016)]|uniref:N-acetyltransferase n=1 Tax=Paenibacillus radicis (ex Gao et al. 2016) TaxID=1737354 RepID=A0A917M635_9BACL|nr:GNAT family N-acetyltransferase [Paenibacillus radicis (ex Gao et al. 2016)]GGG77365.1 N-acetyltransferase [Paenibacillus radicis (ex Gao et al. 2016)]
MEITLTRLSTREEAAILDQAFSAIYPWYSSSDYYMKCLGENQEGKRVTLIAYYGKELAGCCHLLYNSAYPDFNRNQIPEINDLNVFPAYRRKGIAHAMFDELEATAAKTGNKIGLGVGLYKDYGNAQRMYTTRGYMLDGNGIRYGNEEVKPGATVTVDDDLLLYLVKTLG